MWIEISKFLALTAVVYLTPILSVDSWRGLGSPRWKLLLNALAWATLIMLPWD